MKKDDWVMVYEGGSGCGSLLALPVAIGSLVAVIFCIRYGLKPGRQLIEVYLLLVAGFASCALAWKTLGVLWKSVACRVSAPVVYQGRLDHIRFEYPGRAFEVSIRRKSESHDWLVTAGEQTWRLRHSGPWQFEYALQPGTEIRVKYRSGGGPDGLLELWANKGTLNLETAPMERDEWVQVLGSASIGKLIAGSVAVVVLYLPCVIFLLAASLWGIGVWIGNLLLLAGVAGVPEDLDLHLKMEWVRAVWYEKALFCLVYLGAGAAAAAIAWSIVKGAWQWLVAALLPPLVYEGRLDRVYEAPHNRYGFFWELTAGGKTWRTEAFTSGIEEVGFAHQLTPGREIRVVYRRGGGKTIQELWLKEKVIVFEDARLGDDAAETDSEDSAST